MNRRSSAAGISYALTAATLWSAAAVASARAPSAFPAAIVAGAALALTAAAICQRESLHATLRTDPAAYLVLGVGEALNIGLYFGALRLGPPPLVTALHLTSPIVVLLIDLVRRRRRFTAPVVLELGVLAAAAAALAWTTHADRHYRPEDVLIAALMAAGSAGIIAALNMIAAARTVHRAPTAGAALQMWFAAPLLAVPLAWQQPPSGDSVLALFVVGAALTAPALWALWAALRHAPVTTVATVGLSEAIITVILLAALSRVWPAPAAMIAAALIIVAVSVELRSDGVPGTRPRE